MKTRKQALNLATYWTLLVLGLSTLCQYDPSIGLPITFSLAVGHLVYGWQRLPEDVKDRAKGKNIDDSPIP